MKMGPGHRTRKNACLNCGKELDAASIVDEKLGKTTRPSKGDASICINCGHLMVFGNKMMVLRNPTDKEILEIAGDKRMIAIQTALAYINKMKKH